MRDGRRMRMFPLGTVLFPRGVLPLNVFEPRYLTMVAEALEDDATFGVTLIERGFEVGGGDRRFATGTVARIVRAGRLDDGRMVLVTVGEERFEVVEWLPEDPYPAARVAPRPETAATTGLEDAVGDVHRSLRRLLALASELGASISSLEVELPSDPSAAAWTLCAAAPIEQLDRQRLLELDDPVRRMGALQALLEEHTETLRLRLSGR